MSKYYKVEDVQELITACMWRMTLAKERHGEGFVDYSKQVLDVDELTKRISNLPTIEVSEDCISRQQAIDAVIEWYGCNPGDIEAFEEELYNAPSVVPKAQMETQNSNENSNVISVYDGVSEAVRCAMCNNPNKSDRGCDGACSYDEKLYERIIKAIVESVAIIPKAKEGEWIYIDEPIVGNPYGRYRCSKCELEEPHETDYCPNCGCRMKGADK